MRFSLVTVLGLAALPMYLDAQDFPRRDRRPPPAVPAELPPMAPAVAKAFAYKRSRIGVETYPLVTVVHAPTFQTASGGSVWTDFGAGTHVDYRVSHVVLATLDATSSVSNAPARTQTIEVGTRFMRDRFEARTRPFADVRLGYMSAYNRAFFRDEGAQPSPGLPGYASSGFGGVVGAGIHHDLTRSFLLSTSASLMHTRQSSTGLDAESRGFAMTAFRLSVGLRYNPARQIVTPQESAP